MDVREALRSTGGLARAAELRGLGVSEAGLRRAVAAGRAVRLGRAVYGLGPLPAWPARCVQDGAPGPDLVVHARWALLQAGPRACVRGRTAAALLGWGLLVEPSGVELLLASGSRRRVLARTAPRQCRRPRVLDVGRGLRLQVPVDVVLEVCRERPLLEAVVVLDSACRAGTVELGEVETAALRLPRRERARALRVVALADPRSGSVLESVLRVHLLRARLDGFVTQHVVRSRDGRHVLRADFCWPDARLVVETDGSRFHDAARDRHTDNALAAAGWRVLRFTWAEVVHDPERVLGLVREALA